MNMPALPVLQSPGPFLGESRGWTDSQAFKSYVIVQGYTVYKQKS